MDSPGNLYNRNRMTAFSTREAVAVSSRPLPGGDLQWDTFLSRRTPPCLEAGGRRHRAAIAGRRFLVTGAGGWIGSALARALALADAKEIVLLDAAEGLLHRTAETINEIDSQTVSTAVLANVCDAGAVADVLDHYSPETIFHAAAFKHVPLMETNPFAAVANNAVGTWTLAGVAQRHGCRQMVMLSTDKAADPLSLMGASKRIAELAMLTPHADAMRKSVVRLGNVLGSSGSVVPLFLRQIARGGPVTVTDPDVRRYFMTLTEAVDALLSAISPADPDGLLVPDPGTPIRILDLARHLIACEQRADVPIVFTSLRPGDKMEETLISARETCAEGQSGLLRTVLSPMPDQALFDAAMERLQQAVAVRDLHLVLEIVQSLVPEYQPSSLIQAQLAHSATVEA